MKRDLYRHRLEFAEHETVMHKRKEYGSDEAEKSTPTPSRATFRSSSAAFSACTSTFASSICIGILPSSISAIPTAKSSASMTQPAPISPWRA